MPTTKIVADGITKALFRTKFTEFVHQLGMEDIRERLNSIKAMEDLKEKILEARTDHRDEKDYVGWGGKGLNTATGPLIRRNQLGDSFN